MKTLAIIAVISHLSDIHEIINIAEDKKDISNRINFIKYIIVQLTGNLDQEIDVDRYYSNFKKTRFFKK